MLQLAYEPDAFAMRAGKVLEAICTDHGYVKGNLGPRLDKLIADDRLPQVLGDQAHLVREYRNIGSHDDGSLDVEADDVPLIRDFVESLIDYLYWGPAKLQRVKAAIERRQGPSEQRDAKQATQRRADIPARLVSAGVYSKGAPLAIRVPPGVKEDRQAIEAWLGADEARRSVR